MLAVTVLVSVIPSLATAGTIGATRTASPRTVRTVAATVTGSLDALAVRDQFGTDDDPAAYLDVDPGDGRFDLRFSIRPGRP